MEDHNSSYNNADSFAMIFDKVNESDACKQEVQWFYDLTSWAGYTDFLGSENFIKKPANNLIKSHKHVKLPYREGELDDD